MANKIKYLTDKEALTLGLKLNKKQGKRTKARYRITKNQWLEVLENRNKLNSRKFVETIKKYGKEGELLSTTEKLQSEPIEAPDGFEIIKVSTSKTTGQQWVQYAKKKEKNFIDKEIDYNFISEIVKKHIKPIEKTKLSFRNSETFDRLIYTDVHIGMTPNKDGYALYDLKWDEQEILQACKEMALTVVNNKKSSSLYIDELGDFLDGWDAQTTRKGHALPQNMDNQKAFDVAVKFKVSLVDELINYYNEITLNNICEDNHAGSFGYVVNSAVKQILEQKYKNVYVNNMRKFINHYFVGKHCFILTHGKDSKNLKFGFKPQLDPKQSEKIDQYCKENGIYKKAEFIEFCKGDSHQAMYDYSTSNDFKYNNYPAFSPASEWVQTNFKKSKQGFVFETIEKQTEVKHILNYWL